MTTPTVRLAGFGRSLRLMFLVVLFPSLSLPAAEEPSRLYDVPAGDAAVTLRQFAELSGQEMLFAADIVRGVRTNAIRGQFTARAALDRMLQDTSLQGYQDDRVGTWAVRLKPESAVQKSRDTLALQSTSATFTGFVSNAATGNLLEGARIELPRFGIVALTDQTGRFNIHQVPAGTFDVVVSYIGLDQQRSEISAAAGERVVHNFELTSKVYILDPVNVAGEREGNALAMTAQRNAPNVKNVVSMDAFGNLQNLSAGELVVLLPGVAGEIDGQGEIHGAMVRGMDSALNRTTVDGGLMASSLGFDRQFGLHFIGGAIFEQLEVIKGHTPDRTADSLGGTVNLKTRSPLNMKEKRRVTYKFTGRFFPTWIDPIPQIRDHPVHGMVNLAYQEVFSIFGGERNLGVGVNLFYNENVTMAEGTVRDFENTTRTPAYLWDLRNNESYNNRKQSSANVRFDYRLSPTTKFTLSLIANNLQEPFRRLYVSRLFTTQSVGTTGTAGILPGYTDRITQVRAAPGSTIDLTSQMLGVMNRLRSVDFGGEHELGRLKVDYNAAYNYDHVKYGNRDAGYAILVNRITNVGWKIDRTRSDRDPLVTQTEGPDFYNPANYRPSANGLTTRDNDRDTEIKEIRANVRYELPTQISLSFKTGFSWREEMVAELGRDRRFSYVGADALPSDPSIVTAEAARTGRRYPVWDVASIYNKKELVNPSLWSEDLYYREMIKFTGTRAVTEEVTSGYVMAQGKVGALGFLGGVRTEKTEDESWGWVRARAVSTAAQQRDDPVGSAQRDYADNKRVIEGSYTKSFPSAHLMYDITRNLKTRLSWSTSFGRPAMNRLLPNETVNETQQTLTINNPSLLPQTAKNWDATLEYYFEPVGNFSVGWFHKEIKDFIVGGIIGGTVPSGADNGYNGEYAGFGIRTTSNAGTAFVKGWEFSYQQQLQFLPGVLRNLAVMANYTLLDTHGDFGGAATRRSGEIVGFVPRTGNVSLSWRYGRFSTRLLVNGTSEFVNAFTAPGSGRNQYRVERILVNYGVAWQLRPSLSLTCDVANLFNEPTVFYRGIPDQISTHTVNGTTITFGVSGRF
jgi:TonB-dependent receptor